MTIGGSLTPMLPEGGLSQQISRLVATELAIIRGIHRSCPHPAAVLTLPAGGSHHLGLPQKPHAGMVSVDPPGTTPDSNPTRTTEDPISRKVQPIQ